MKLGTGSMVPRYRVFLSSADDALDLRGRVDSLINNALNPVLANAQTPAVFQLEMWDKSAPRKLQDGETIDDEFVRKAVGSDLVLTLLVEQLGEGTKREINAALAADTEIAALWFVPRDQHPDSPVGRFLKELGDDQKLRYDRAGAPDTDASWEGLFRVLLTAVLSALEPQEDDYRERR